MKILVTGANGFIGKNLIAELRSKGYNNIFAYSKESELEDLAKYTQECDFVFHLAGVNRSNDNREFLRGNVQVTQDLISFLRENKNFCPVLFTSSIHADSVTTYGISKKAAENILFSYASETEAEVLIYRLPNIFGKWCKPNYNSVVATFCHKLARNQSIEIHNADETITLCYINDLIDQFLLSLEGRKSKTGEFCEIPASITYNITVGELADKIISFKANRETLIMPSLEDRLEKALYGTYLSYLEEDNFSYKLNKIEDSRGWLAEFIKSKSMGQIFISYTKPGIARGNHWHHTKVEKFLVLQGQAIIRLRKINHNDILEYKVRGEIPEVIDIPVGYTHSIINTGSIDLITLFWASEFFNPDTPDTYYMEV